MASPADSDQIDERLQQELARLWDEYLSVPDQEKDAARVRYLAALRRFAAYVNPA
jgi:hypothetical protein